MYKSLKAGWITLSSFCEKYNKDKSNMNRLLKNLSDEYKEQLGRTWVIVESEFKKLI